MKILLLRHAKSNWDGNTDFERTLTDKGREQSASIGEWLLAQQLRPDRILASPAYRAKETIEIVADRANIERDKIEWVDNIYNAHPDLLYKIIQAQTVETILLVGHNPGIETVINMLDNSATINGMGTANLAIVDYEKRKLIKIVKP